MKTFHFPAVTLLAFLVFFASASSSLSAVGDRPSDCVDDTWTPINTINVPTARFNHTAVWTGTEMIVCGGESDTGRTNTGGRYNPSTDTWTATSTTNAPSGRDEQT